MIGIDHFTALASSNIQAAQRFYALAWETGRELLLLQMRSYQSLFTGKGNIEEALREWQGFAEESASKTAEFTNQHIDSFARLQANVAEDVERSANSGEPIQYSRDANQPLDKTLVGTTIGTDERVGSRQKK